jgi:hypothetical protein
MNTDFRELIVVFFVFGGGFWVLAPLARALAKRISGDNRRPDESPALDEMRAELQQVKGEVAELAERLDFTERMLAKQNAAERLPPPS